MAANVRCAGKTIPPVTIGGAEVGLPDAAYAPCGWTGERFPRPLLTHRGVMFDTVKATEKPCPRCGGRVELIPRG